MVKGRFAVDVRESGIKGALGEQGMSLTLILATRGEGGGERAEPGEGKRG